jgi:hypothetical protein
MITPQRAAQILLLLSAALVASTAAHAQNMTDVVTITAGGIYLGPEGAGFKAIGLSYGSAAPAVTSNGYTYEEICDNGAFSRKGVGVSPSSQIAIGGFPSNPGQAWLTSATANGVTTQGSAATYSYSGGVAT